MIAGDTDRVQGREFRNVRIGVSGTVQWPDEGAFEQAVVADAAAGLRIFVGEVRALPSLKSVISREAGGRGRVTVVLDLPSREVEIAIPGGFKVDPGTFAAVKSLPGVTDVHEI
jgi:DNA polymerase-3 subunit alpha